MLLSRVRGGGAANASLGWLLRPARPLPKSKSAIYRQTQAKSRKSYSPGYMEQSPSRGHEASSQCGLGVGSIKGLGKGGALSLVPIIQATTEEVHHVYYKPRHKPRLRWSNALLQGERGICLATLLQPKSPGTHCQGLVRGGTQQGKESAQKSNASSDRR